MSQSRPHVDHVRRAEAGETVHEAVAEGNERWVLGQDKRGDAAAEEAQTEDQQRQVSEQEGGARDVHQRATPTAEAPKGEAGESPLPLAATTSTLERPPKVTRQLDRTTAAGMTAETSVEEVEEEAAAERAPGDADRQSVAAGQAVAEAVGDDERNHHGPADEGGYARGASDTPAHADDRGPRPPRARSGQRRLGVGLAPARPGPLAGWEHQSTLPRDPAADVFPSSQQRQEAQEEGEVERRAVKQADDEAHEEVAVLAASAADRRRRAGKIG
ncbi:unnamed protein product [Closterium sp. Naga37s-1]|nr:unnamed protein product [Closterium sp. Naga37s-1]